MHAESFLDRETFITLMGQHRINGTLISYEYSKKLDLYCIYFSVNGPINHS